MTLAASSKRQFASDSLTEAEVLERRVRIQRVSSVVCGSGGEDGRASLDNPPFANCAKDGPPGSVVWLRAVRSMEMPASWARSMFMKRKRAAFQILLAKAR